MAAFEYQALDKTGKSITGVHEADNLKQARQQLREQELNVLTIKASSGKHAQHKNMPWWQRFNNRISTSDQALITRQLAILLGAGISLEEALGSIAEQAEKTPVKNLILGLRAKILEGFSLAGALGSYSHVFSTLYCATVAAGEKTGRLEIVLERLADFVERRQQIQQQIIQAAIYPSLIALTSIGIVSFLLSFVVPKMVGVFSDTGQALPPITSLLLTISSLLQNYGLYSLIAMVIIIILFNRALRKHSVRYKWDGFLLKLPLLGKTIRFVNTARFAHTFAMLNNAGIDVLEAMKVGGETVGNVLIRDSLVEATRQVREGLPISRALQKCGYFPPLSIQLIASGENSGNLSQMLERSANSQETTVQSRISLLLSLFEPMVILIMGGVVLFIVLAILLPIFNLNQMTG